VRLLKRLLQRLLVFGLGVTTIWLIVFVVFKFADHRLPWMLALGVTCGLAAYVILPRAGRMSLKILQRKHVPRFTMTGDGLPGDPVNLVLTGTLKQPQSAFKTAEWSQANRLGLASSWRMVVAHGRGVRLQLALSDRTIQHPLSVRKGSRHRFPEGVDSPRKRHHIRFWALALDHAEKTVATAAFWLNTDRPPECAHVHWVGAGTRDTDISLTRLSFQVIHATDDDTNAERDYIVAELMKHQVIEDVTSHEAGQRLPAGWVNHYVADGTVSVATLMATAVCLINLHRVSRLTVPECLLSVKKITGNDYDGSHSLASWRMTGIHPKGR
jgi:hypothetical protein